MNFKKRKISKINLLEDTANDSYETKTIPIQQNIPVAHTPQPTGNKFGSKKIKKMSRKRTSCFFIILIILFTFIGSVVSSDNDSFLAGVKNGYLLRQITNIISSSEKYLTGEKDDRINFVLMGVGGAGHDGPYLTDTMIIASFKPSTKKATLISLPRDMIVPLSPGDYRKINSIYTIGENRQTGGGGDLVKEVLSKTLDLPMHYFAVVDFDGFIEIIDSLDGIKVDVEKSFTDYQFPTADYKYQEISFEAGEQKMDGLTALRFARSRHGNNGEGSDFARIARQQKIMLAAKDKITSFNTLINPKKITSLFSLFNKYTTTDLEPWELVKLVHLAKEMNTQEIVTQSIDDAPGGYLKAGITMEGAFILQPVTGNFNQLRDLVKNIFDLEELSQENAKIVIQNGTKSPGLALKAVNHLNQIGYNVIRYGNSADQEKITTVIYDYTENKTKTRKSLEAVFQTEAQTNIPLEYTNSVIASEWGIYNDNNELEQLDFLIILGADQEIDDSLEIITTIDPSLLSTSTASTTIIITE